MRFHDTIVGVFLMLLGGFILQQASGFPQMPGQSIGPGTFPTVFAVAFILGGGVIAFQGWRTARAARAIALNPGWRSRDRFAATAIALLGALALVSFFDVIGFPIGAGLLLSALYLALGHRSPIWIAVSFAFAGVLYYGMAKLLFVPLPLGPLG